MHTDQVFFVIGISLATVATLSGVLAFGLPSWIYTYDMDSEIGISYAGLWTFCLETFFDQRYNYNGGIPMYGCHWIYSYELREIRWTILNPNWYIAVQIMATVNLILSLLGLLGLYIICFVKKNNCPLIFGIISMFICSLLGFCEVFLYGLRVRDEEYYKVPNVRSKSLGAGWGFAVISAILSAAALVALVVSYTTTRRERRALKKSQMLAEAESQEHEKRLRGDF